MIRRLAAPVVSVATWVTVVLVALVLVALVHVIAGNGGTLIEVFIVFGSLAAAPFIARHMGRRVRYGPQTPKVQKQKQPRTRIGTRTGPRTGRLARMRARLPKRAKRSGTPTTRDAKGAPIIPGVAPRTIGHRVVRTGNCSAHHPRRQRRENG